MTPDVKVCGVRDPGFAAAAAGLGVDYVGVIFASASPRCVTVETARAIAAAARRVPRAAPPRVVGVFVEQSEQEVLQMAASVPLDVVQLHGGRSVEAAAAARRRGLEVWRLVAADNAPDATDADALLLDGSRGGRSGGTGCCADWSRVAELKRQGRRVVLAGGLSAANIRQAAATGADILDVNSSLETAVGEKSVPLLEALMCALRGVSARERTGGRGPLHFCD